MEIINHNPLWDSHRKGADYTRVEVRRENNTLVGVSHHLTNPALLTRKVTETGVHALDVRELGLIKHSVNTK